MKPEQWQAIHELFDEAVTLPPDQRSAWLNEACVDDTLREQVVLMLAADADDSADPGAIVQAAASDSFAPSIEPGTQLDGYRVVAVINHGGMGSVYQAERAGAGFDQRVAIKVINVALAGPQVVSRFKSERQILARLEHPNIARLIDGGTTPTGAPYLVMEYVDGLPITTYCDQNNLNLTQRLRLFEQVCAAIHTAHQNLIVHRDIKPDNILVTANGTPKLLDFGIAKIIDEHSANATLALTQANMRLYTPLYASPEQVRGAAITTASDIYSLGVLLYELLVGRSPYGERAEQRESLVTAIVGHEPQKPSAVEKRKRLRGDLDNIVLMALRKEPERRYGSARQFALDVGAYLDERPVTARNDTPGYRLSKFVLRNRAAVAIGSVAVLGMLSLAGFYTYELAAERDRAKAEATRANQTALFLRNLFRLSDPDESGGETITARMLLDQGVRQLDLTLGEQPQIRAQLQTTMGEVYASLGILEEAGKLLDTARGELEKTTPLPRAELVTTLNALSAVRMRLDKFEDAHKFAEQAIALANGTDDILPFASELEKANAFTMESRHEEAIALLQDMRSRLEQAAMTDTALYASTLTVMAENVEINGDYDSAVSALERAVDIYLRLGGRLNGETIHAQRTLAHLYDRKRDFPASKALYDQAYEAAFQLYGEVHPTMSLVLADMSTLHRHMGDNATAFGYSERALAISREVFGSEHSHVAYDMVALANLGYLARGMSYAEPLYLEALDIYGRTVRAEHPYIAAALISYANRLETENRHEDARAALDRGRGVCIAALGAQHWLCGQFDTVFGIVLRKEGNEQAATSLLLNGFETGRVGRGVGHGATKRALQQLVENLDALGDPRAAEYRTLLEDTSSPNR